MLNGEELAFEGANKRKGLFTRVMQIEGKPYNNEEDAKKMYEIIKEQYGTAGPYFIQKLIETYGGNDYIDLKEKYRKIHDIIVEDSKVSEEVSLYYDYLTIIMLADELVGEWIFEEKNVEENSLRMIEEVSKKIYMENSDYIKELYEDICSWIIKEHKSFSMISKCRKEGFNEDSIETIEKTNIGSLGIYDVESFNVFREILQHKIENKGYSYRKVVSEFGKRGYIEVKRNLKNGNIESNSIQKKYGGITLRFFKFPIEKMLEILPDEHVKTLKERIDEEANELLEEQFDYEDTASKLKETESILEEISKETDKILEVDGFNDEEMDEFKNF